MDSHVQIRLHINRKGTVDNDAPFSLQPESIVHVTLKKHQLQTIHAMHMLECNRKRISDHEYLVSEIGVLSNKVGSGKSLCVLGLIGTNRRLEPQDFVTCHISNAMFVMHDRSNMQIGCGNLIVVPHHMIPFWEEYVHEYTTFDHMVIKKRMFPLDWNEVSKKDVVICGSKYYNMVHKSCPWTWSRVVFDEADSINIPACVQPNARFVWFVTSSLKNLLFSSGFYLKCDSNGIVTRVVTRGIVRQGYIKTTFRELEDDSSNHVIQGIVVKMNDEYIDQHINLPSVHEHIVRCKDPVYLCILKDVISDGVASRLHGCDSDGALEYMGSPMGTKENIISFVCRSFQSQQNNYQLKLDYLNNMKSNMDSLNMTHQVDEKIRKTQHKLNDIQYKLKSIHERVELVANEDLLFHSCPICMDDAQELCMYMCCLNMFCKRCVHKMNIMNTQTCPMCRGDLRLHDIMMRSNNIPTLTESRNKYEKVLDIVKSVVSRPDTRVLIFTWHENTLTQLTHALYAQHFQFFRILSGNVNTIKHKIDCFNKGSVRVLLVNASVYGCGLNLIGATDIIFFQKTNTEIEKQLVGRAHRIGRTHELHIHRILHESE